MPRKPPVRGAAGCLVAKLTAKIAAAAASSLALKRLPPPAFFASLEFPAGSRTTLATDIAEARINDLTGVTSPCRQARRKARTSSAPSLKPWPRNSNRATGTRAAFRASRSSASRQRSAETPAGEPKRSSAAAINSDTDTAAPPHKISSPQAWPAVYRRPTPSFSPAHFQRGLAGERRQRL